MAPNWFIGFVVQAPGLLASLEEPPGRVRLFTDADLHMTVAFLGSVGREAALAAWAAGERARFRAVDGRFTAVKALGPPRRPTAISALAGDGGEALSEMIGEAREAMWTAANARPDARPPLPHVTLARVQRRASKPEHSAALAWAHRIDVANHPFSVGRVALYTWARDRQARLFDIVEARSLTMQR